MNALEEKYRDRVQFLLVYIREAHSTDGWQTPRNKREGVLLESAKTFEMKEEHATVCQRKLDIRFTTLIDEMDNKVESDYTAWPTGFIWWAKTAGWRGRAVPARRAFGRPSWRRRL